MRRYTAHLHTASTGDIAGSEIDFKQFRRLFCVLAIQLKEIPHLKQHEVIRVGFLDGVIFILCLRRQFAFRVLFPLKLLVLCLFLRGQETVFADQLGDTGGNLAPF